jgi:hypothetical protein
MTIPLDDPNSSTTALPVIKRRRIGEQFTGALVRFKPRDVMKDGEPVLKPNGKPRQELVVTMVTMPGTDMQVGLGDYQAEAKPGDIVRAILRGGGYGAWIEANNELKGRVVGDVVTLTTEFGQAYDANGKPHGDRLTTQAEVDKVPRSNALGLYGPISIRRAKDTETEWVELAEEAYQELSAEAPAGSTPLYDEMEEPF